MRFVPAFASHLTPPLDVWESKTDDELEQIVLNTQTAEEVRERLADARAQGYIFLPCSCADHAPDGSCLGWSE